MNNIITAFYSQILKYATNILELLQEELLEEELLEEQLEEQQELDIEPCIVNLLAVLLFAPTFFNVLYIPLITSLSIILSNKDI